MSKSLLAMALYRPHSGKEEALHNILVDHIPTLRAENLITEREAIRLQAEDGTIIEIFEWNSTEAKDQAHILTTVRGIWNQISEVATIATLSSLPESARPFPNFKPL